MDVKKPILNTSKTVVEVNKKELEEGDRLPPKYILYRIVMSTVRDRKNKNIPSAKLFSLSPADKDDDYGLSVDWSEKTTPEESIARIGGQYRTGLETFKNYNDREIYSIDENFINNLNIIKGVFYNPLINNPEKRGNPNNSSHSLIKFNSSTYDKYEPEIILKIRDHAISNKVEFDKDKVEKLVSVIRTLPK